MFTNILKRNWKHNAKDCRDFINCVVLVGRITFIGELRDSEFVDFGLITYSNSLYENNTHPCYMVCSAKGSSARTISNLRKGASLVVLGEILSHRSVLPDGKYHIKTIVNAIHIDATDLLLKSNTTFQTQISSTAGNTVIQHKENL